MIATIPDNSTSYEENEKESLVPAVLGMEERGW